MTNIKTYSEMIKLPTFIERFRYLKLQGTVGEDTFGYDRYLNQILYTSPEWRQFRNVILLRDNGCDLACEGFEIPRYAIIHHINPISLNDIINRNPNLFDPENVVTTVLRTHNALHYGDETQLIIEPVVRTRNDTCPWKK